MQISQVSSLTEHYSEAIHGLRLMSNKATFAEGHSIWVEVADKISLVTEAWEIGEATHLLKNVGWVKSVSGVVEKLSVVLDVVSRTVLSLFEHELIQVRL